MNMRVARGRFVASQQQNKARGITLFGFAAVVTIIAILATVLLQRLKFYERQAEEVAALRMQADLRTVLYMKIARLRASGRDAEVAALAGQNPMNWLPEKPANYRGEFAAAAAPRALPDSWYFDRTARNLVYLSGDSNTLQNGSLARRCFKVESLRLPPSPAKPQGTSEIKPGVALIQVNG